jgi:putative transposase
MSPIKRTSHALYDLKCHVVWAPKHRKIVLTGDFAKTLKLPFQELTDSYEFEVDRMEVNEDHVHLFFSAPPRYSPAQVVQILKSVSARMIFQRIPKDQETPLPGRTME